MSAPIAAGAPSEVTIRPFRPSDQDAVRRLVLAGLAERWGALDASLNPDLDDVAAAYPVAGGAFLVAEIGGVLAGTGALVVLAPGTSRIVRMSVDAAWRRRGIARRLVGVLLDEARRRGCGRVVVATTPSWASAIALYQQCGFVQYARDDDDVYLAIALR